MANKILLSGPNTVKTSPSFFSDFFTLLLSTRRFLELRFMHVTATRIYLMSYVCIFLGLVGGSLLTCGLSHWVTKDFAVNSAQYLVAIERFGLKADGFLALLKTQQAYSLMIACLSPIIAYVAPHLFGGALYVFLWLVYRPNEKLQFQRVMECAALALCSMIFYFIPAFGPIISMVMVGVNVSRALALQFELVGFLKTMSIISAMYLCFFLSSATLQLLAVPVAKLFE